MINMNSTDTIDQFLPFAKATAAKFCAMPSVAAQYDVDDLTQELLIRVIDKIQEFDESKGMKLSTYGCQIIKWRAGEIHKACVIKAERGEGYLASIDAMDGTSEDGGRSDDWHPATYDDASLHYLESLSERDRDIVMRHTVNGESLRSIGRDYGVSGEAVRLWHNAAMDQVREAF